MSAGGIHQTESNLTINGITAFVNNSADIGGKEAEQQTVPHATCFVRLTWFHVKSIRHHLNDCSLLGCHEGSSVVSSSSSDDVDDEEDSCGSCDDVGSVESN